MPTDRSGAAGGRRPVTDREAVLRSLREFDLLGRDPFLSKHGFERSRNHPIELEGQLYDSIPIHAVAHGFQFPAAARLTAEDYGDGFQPVVQELEALGFSTRYFDGSDHPDAGYWWHGRPDERYWVEVRNHDRALGTELRAGVRDAKFKVNSWYELLAELAPGDVVFHWQSRTKSFVGVSRVARPVSLDESRGDRIVPLVDFRPLPNPVTRENLLRLQNELEAIRDDLRHTTEGALHVPFAFRSDGIRLMPNYFGKLPAQMARLIFGDALPALELPAPEVDEASELIEELAGRPRQSGRRAYRLNYRERRAIEVRAMKVAEQWLKEHGWPTVEDKSARESYDLLAANGRREIKVEVKGTTSLGESILLTKNERLLHLATHPDNGLIVVSRIQLERGEEPAAHGGEVLALVPWVLEESRLTPLAFSYDVFSSDDEGSSH